VRSKVANASGSLIAASDTLNHHAREQHASKGDTAMMNELPLTKDERLCLQAWFRQAIVQLEREEVTARLLKEHAAEAACEDGHRSPVIRRRSRRSTFSHVSQFAKAR